MLRNMNVRWKLSWKDEHQKFFVGQLENFETKHQVLRFCDEPWTPITACSSLNIRFYRVWLFFSLYYFMKLRYSWKRPKPEHSSSDANEAISPLNNHQWEWEGGERPRVSSPLLINFSCTNFQRWRCEMVNLTTQQQWEENLGIRFGLEYSFFFKLACSYHIERGQVSTNTSKSL